MIQADGSVRSEFYQAPHGYKSVLRYFRDGLGIYRLLIKDVIIFH